MPFTDTILPADRLALVVAHGRIDFGESLRTGVELTGDASFDPSFDVLVDLRRMDFVPDLDEISGFAADLAGVREGYKGKIAVLVSGPYLLQRAQMICTIATSSGMPMKAFSRLEAVRGWFRSES